MENSTSTIKMDENKSPASPTYSPPHTSTYKQDERGICNNPPLRHGKKRKIEEVEESEEEGLHTRTLMALIKTIRCVGPIRTPNYENSPVISNEEKVNASDFVNIYNFIDEYIRKNSKTLKLVGYPEEMLQLKLHLDRKTPEEYIITCQRYLRDFVVNYDGGMLQHIHYIVRSLITNNVWIFNMADSSYIYVSRIDPYETENFNIGYVNPLGQRLILGNIKGEGLKVLYHSICDHLNFSNETQNVSIDEAADVDCREKKMIRNIL